MREWLDKMNDAEATKEVASRLIPMMEACGCDVCKQILAMKHYLIKKSTWIFGGDGWAYDIGFGGLDHVIASGHECQHPRTGYGGLLEYGRTVVQEHADRRGRQVRIGRQARPQERSRRNGNDLRLRLRRTGGDGGQPQPVPQRDQGGRGL